MGTSKLGGSPDLAEDVLWPCINEKPLAFLGQINFKDILWTGLVPKTLDNKLLAFFISGYQEHYREGNPRIHKTIIQDIDSQEEFRARSFPDDLDAKFQFDESVLTFSKSFSVPSYQHWKIEELHLNETDEQLYSEEVLEIFNECLGLNYQPGHQMFGYSNAIQGDTNGSWAAKHLNNAALSGDLDLNQLEKTFKQLLQIDLMQGFESISDGCAYFGFLETEGPKIKIECELQN